MRFSRKRFLRVILVGLILYFAAKVTYMVGTILVPQTSSTPSGAAIDAAAVTVKPNVMEYTISRTWDGKPINDTIHVKLEQAEHAIKVLIKAPFYNDPPPSDPPGPTDMLWEHEVVEVFFLKSNSSEYLELEFGPHGNYLALLLKGRRNIIQNLLPLKYTAKVTGESNSSWVGEAEIPVSYFPPQVDRFNAFAIHGSKESRQYSALYSQVEPITQPDFHRLQDYQPIKMSELIPSNESRDFAKVWRKAMLVDG